MVCYRIKPLTKVQVALVIRCLFICKLAYSHLKNDLKWQFSSHKWTFYLQIQDSRSKMLERIYRINEGNLYINW